MPTHQHLTNTQKIRNQNQKQKKTPVKHVPYDKKKHKKH